MVQPDCPTSLELVKQLRYIGCVCGGGGRSSCYNRIPSVCWDGGYALAGISCKQTPDEGRNGNREMQFDFFRVPEHRL